MSSSRYVINSILRAVKLLECFSPKNPALTNSQLAKRLGLNKSTITRLVYSLVEAGLLRKDIKTGEYSLTYRLFQIGSTYINHISFPEVAKPLLSELAASSKEAVHLAVLNDDEVLYIDKVEGAETVGMLSRVGKKCPAYCTGVGKVLLAHLNKNDLKQYLRNVKLKRFTANTITDTDDLKNHLQEVRLQGYAIDDSEHEADIKCVAAPLFDSKGKIVASISITGPSFRISCERLEKELSSAVVETAKNISDRLGYMGDS